MAGNSAQFTFEGELDGAIWHKSTHSGAANGCVERGRLTTGRQAVRDTKNRDRGAIVFDPKTWQTFVTAVRNGAL